MGITQWEKIIALKSILALILNIHFRNAELIQVKCKDIFDKDFCKIGDKDIATKLFEYMKKYDIKRCIKQLNKIDINEILE